MGIERREFLKTIAVASGALAGVSKLSGKEKDDLSADRFGVLSDLTYCVGCHKCELACNEANDLPKILPDSSSDKSVFENMRRPTAEQYTVVNSYPDKGLDGGALNVKVQCMHCEHPPCVSACIVGALRKHPDGPVTYNASACIGCRYCIIACPFQIPAYEYDKVLTPQVRKCTLCFERTIENGQLPACVDICPTEAIVFGHRQDLLDLALERIRKNPDRYVDHIYGEHEIGGTSWMYLSNQPFVDIDFPELGNKIPAELTESIQHGIFKGFSGPIMLFGLLGIIMKVMKKEENE
ncbi:MAG: 4Fe-4S dicluster domain-containing protein [Candidatus Marinimicrobia bacterium]|nr:4Fe-4S dicluster domain-containing protein [Candidatus Neomarinimicrobiota bacterium]